MQLTARPSPIRRLTGLVLVALGAILILQATAAVARTVPTKRVVKVATLSDGGSVLASLRGRTLYSLSVEKHGKFICTGGCLSIWHPLVVGPEVEPRGPVALSTIERPDGRTQVTYRGRPLYTFAEDTKAGEDKGEGLKDVGTWHAAKPKTSSPQQPTEPAPTPPTPYPTAPYPPPQSPSPPQSPPPEQPPYEYPPYPY